MLQAVLGLERQDASAFQPLPFHYIEVGHLRLCRLAWGAGAGGGIETGRACAPYLRAGVPP